MGKGRVAWFTTPSGGKGEGLGSMGVLHGGGGLAWAVRGRAAAPMGTGPVAQRVGVEEQGGGGGRPSAWATVSKHGSA
jgi:hypothetical protein